MYYTPEWQAWICGKPYPSIVEWSNQLTRHLTHHEVLRWAREIDSLVPILERARTCFDMCLDIPGSTLEYAHEHAMAAAREMVRADLGRELTKKEIGAIHSRLEHRLERRVELAQESA